MIFSISRLSTGAKMLALLSTALLPLGLIALFASLDLVRSNRLVRESEAQSMAVESGRRIDGVLAMSAQALRVALALEAPGPPSCNMAARTLSPSQRRDVRVAIFSGAGRMSCGDQSLADWSGRRPAQPFQMEARLLPSRPALYVVVAGTGESFGIAELKPGALAKAAAPDSSTGPYQAALIQGDRRMTLIVSGEDPPLDERVTAVAPIAKGQAEIETVVRAAPITTPEMVMAVSPLLMWVAAAVFAWIVVERLLLSPLAQMQRAILNYRAGDGPLVVPRLKTPALELRGLGEAFRKVTQELADHEAELEEGLARQRRLTREVHHRVKNNLQVVSSLINLHSRGATDPAVAAAYASIQRRVDALAIVHRNHYAELEENLGVSLRALVGELAANLRAMAPPEGARMAITLNMMPAFVTQDVAVPVAFLVTEVVELVTICAPRSSVAIMLQPGSTPDRALLTIDAPGLDQEACLAHPAMDRFRRIIQGLGRQLRSTLHHEEYSGRYQIEITVVPENRA